MHLGQLVYVTCICELCVSCAQALCETTAMLALLSPLLIVSQGAEQLLKTQRADKKAAQVEKQKHLDAAWGDD